MIRTCVLALSAAALLAPAARAQDDAKAIVEKAIKAHGGADTLDKYKAGKGKLKGVIIIMGQEVEIAGDMSFMYPDKGKAVLTLSVQGQKISITQLIAGDRVEVVVMGMKQPIPDEQAADVRMSQYIAYLTQLTPLLKGDQLTLKALGETKFEGVKLFFDKDSGMLIKADHMSTDEGGKQVLTEQIFGAYKEFKGIKVPTKETVIKDGKKSQEIVTEAFEPLEKLDDKTFTVED
jgi:hypothetical protein